MIKSAMYIFIGYIVSATCSQYVSFYMSMTDWDSLWTYGWILFWPLFLIVKLGIWVIAFIVAALVGYGLYQAIAGRA